MRTIFPFRAEHEMASLAAVGSARVAAQLCPALASSPSSARQQRKVTVRKMSSFGGLRSENKVTKLGYCESTETHFARIVACCYAATTASKGGAAASTCDIASEIFRVVPIMSALVLIGVALGFVLLRIEAAVEESE